MRIAVLRAYGQDCAVKGLFKRWSDEALLYIILVLAAVLLGYCVSASASAFKSFDFPGATETVLNDINNKNTAVGYYLDQSGIAHGFVATQSGELASFDLPESVATYAYGINDFDQIVGWYEDRLGTQHGYVYHSGTFMTIDPPNSMLTNAWDIANSHVVVGTFLDQGFGIYRGFLLQRGIYSTYDAPGATHTEIHGIDTSFNLVGAYFDSNGIEHGFLSGGNFVDITHKGSTVTIAERIAPVGNDTNVLGSYADSDSGPFTSYRIKNLFGNKIKFIAFAYPGAADTRIRGINDAHWIVGRYTDSAGKVHGFVFMP